MSLGVCHAVCVRRISLDGEANALYPMLSTCVESIVALVALQLVSPKSTVND